MVKLKVRLVLKMLYEDYVKTVNGGSYFIPTKGSSKKELIDMSAYFIKEAKNICILTGAGISTNIGIPDFRSKEGWYSKNPSDILSFDNFMKNPKEVYSFLYRYLKLIDVEPSITHKLIANLESKGKTVSVLTQNIDMLHSKAGSTDIIEFHGSFEKANCVCCNKCYPIDYVLNDSINNDDFNYKCSCGGCIKPNILLFGEDIVELTFAQRDVSKADLILIIGTSMCVAPFCELSLLAPLETPFILINNSATYLDDNRMSVVLRGDCDTLMTILFEKLNIL